MDVYDFTAPVEERKGEKEERNGGREGRVPEGRKEGREEGKENGAGYFLSSEF